MSEEVKQTNPEDEISVKPASTEEPSSTVVDSTISNSETEATAAQSDQSDGETRRHIKIGSQRTPFQRVASTPNPVNVAPADHSAPAELLQKQSDESSQPSPTSPEISEGKIPSNTPATTESVNQPEQTPPVKILSDMTSFSSDDISDLESGLIEVTVAPEIELPNDLQTELDEALDGISLDDLLSDDGPSQAEATLENESRAEGIVVSVHRDNVFINLQGQRNQAVASLRQFDEPPAVGAKLTVIVKRFSIEDGLYEVAVPGASMRIGDWSDVTEGMTVDCMVTGYNKGGLECELSRLRCFIPAGQVSLYHVDDLEQFVGQKLTCVVTEASEEKRNLVLSHRAVLEREKEVAKEKLLAELAVGQEREAVVSRIMDFGAFVDLGGIDGLIHISQMSWDRVKHPSEVLEEGQRVKVKIEKIDPVTGKIGLAYRDLFENPWVEVPHKYPVKTTATGTVSKIMDFGAFVRLEAGVEGLVHVSEISHQRVFRVSDVLSQGQEVEVQIQSIDVEAQRISLSMKALEARMPPKTKDDQTDETKAEETDDREPVKKFKGTLKGGIGGRGSDGDKFGLNW